MKSIPIAFWLVLAACFIQPAAHAQNEAPTIPEILIAESIDGDGFLHLVRYQTIHIGMQGATVRSRSLKAIPLAEAKFQTVAGEALSTEQAAAMLSKQKETPVLATSYGEPVAPEYSSLFDSDGLVIVFAGRSPIESKSTRRAGQRKQSTAKAKALQSVQKIDDQMVRKAITPLPGVFRFVVCDASNQIQLAELGEPTIRRETKQLVETQFKSALTAALAEAISADKLEQLTAKLNLDLDTLLDSIQITARWQDDRTEIAKAYVIAELDRDQILELTGKQIQQSASSIGLTEEQVQSVKQQLAKHYQVGWAGNPYQFMISGFADPLKK